jgi:hypothetical protein
MGGRQQLHQPATSPATAVAGCGIPDRGVPDSAVALPALRALAERLQAGHHVVAYCRSGIGRASLLAAALLVLEGLDPNQAWSLLARARGQHIPYTDQQRQGVARLPSASMSSRLDRADSTRMMRLTPPSTAPELYGKLKPLTTASRSRLSPAVNECRSGSRSAWTVAIHLWKFAAQPSHHLGERCEVTGDGIQVRAADQYLLQLELLVDVEAGGMARHPACHLADLGRHRRWWQCAAQLAKRAQVWPSRQPWSR